MSEEQSPVPAPRRLIAGTPASAPKPRLLAGSTEGLGKLKVSMTPEQEAAIAKAKAQREAEEAARKQQEEYYAQQQARYEEELRAYEEYQAAEKLRLEEEARLAAQNGTAAPVVTPVAPQAIPMPVPEPIVPQGGYDPSQMQGAPATETAQAAYDPALLQQQQQWAAAQPDPAPAAHNPAVPVYAQETIPQATPAIHAAAPLAGQPSPLYPSGAAPAQHANIPVPGVQAPVMPSGPAPLPTIPPVANPAIQPTTPVPGKSFAPPRRPMTEADFNITPIWKKKAFWVPVIGAAVTMGGLIAAYYPKYAQAKEVEERYLNYARMARDESRDSITALPADVTFVLEKLKTDNLSWEAAAATLGKMVKGTPEATDIIMDQLLDNYRSFLLPNGDNIKAKRLFYYLLVQDRPPSDLREKAFEFFERVPDDYKPDVLFASNKLMLPGDINRLIEILNDPAFENNQKLKYSAERAAARVMERTPDKQSLSEMILSNYEKADDNRKNIYVRLMGRTGDETGLNFLTGILNNPDSTVIAIRNALTALGNWPNDDAIAVLMDYYQKNKEGELEKNIKDELYKSLRAPGRERDMKKVQPLVDFMKEGKSQNEKLLFIAALSGNAQTDTWALDLLKAFYDDNDDKVSYEAEKAVEAVNKRKAPEKAKTDDSGDSDLELPES